MQQLKKSILEVIQNPNSLPWFPELTEVLVNFGWQQLNEKYEIQAINYSTEAVLNKGSTYILCEKIVNVKPAIKQLLPINIYPVPDMIKSMYVDSGAKPYTAEILKNSPVLQCLQEALDILAEIPTVYETVSRLIVSLHLLQPNDDEFDISFSLPDIPFSIFVSVPSKRMKNDAVRVAEAILHEAMHLQLTLTEHYLPLVIETDEKYLSPWKNANRHPRGVLHAIYVFCVIKQFYKLLLQKDISETFVLYLKNRCDVISNQLSEVKAFMHQPYFTEAGQVLINILFQQAESKLHILKCRSI